MKYGRCQPLRLYLFVLLSPLLASGQEKDLPLKELLPRVPPLEPAEALKTFEIEKGFRVELVAAEPEVVDPTDMAFDEDGRIYVTAMRSYSYEIGEDEQPMGQIRLLEDLDDDGRYERSTIFADALNCPCGVATFGGGVYVCAMPDIVYLKDTDGDRIADVRRVVFTDFERMRTEDSMNNLKWGLDHKIYGLSSYNSGIVRTPEKPGAPSVAVRGYDFRFDPVVERFETVSGGRGNFGHSFDDWGNRFVGNAGLPMSHVVLPQEYLARNPHLAVSGVHQAVSTVRRVQRISPPEPWRIVRARFWHRWVNTTHNMRAARFGTIELTPAGFVTGASGITVYRGSAYPEAYRGNAFFGEASGNVVVRLRLRPTGVTFASEREPKDREFLASTDIWFRPVNFVNGPDGCLYMLDMYRETIEHHSAIPDDMLKILDVRSGNDRGRIYRIVPEGFRRPPPPRLGRASTPQLVAALDHGDAWWRETAARLLFERQDKAAAVPLRELVRTAELPQARLHALWSLRGLKTLDDATLLGALEDPVAPVREHAVRLAEARLENSATLRDRVLALADDDAPRVRLQLAFSLSATMDERATGALARIAGRDAGDDRIRTAVLIAARNRAPSLLSAVLADDRFLKQSSAAEFVKELVALIGSCNQPTEVAAALDATLSREQELEARFRRLVVRGLGEGLRRTGSSLEEFLRTSPPAAGTATGLEALFNAAIKVAHDKNQTPSDRLEAVGLLAHASYTTAAPALAELLTARESRSVQVAAVRGVAQLSGPQVGELLVGRWGHLSPPVRREVAEALFSRPHRLTVLLSALEKKQVATRDLDPSRMQTLLKHPDVQIRRRAETLVSAATQTPRRTIVEEYRSALTRPGDPVRGAEVFKTQCATCHKVSDRETSVGPDLAGMQKHSDEELLIAILDPNRSVDPNFVLYMVYTIEGNLLTGIIAEETPTSITLRRAEGVEETVLRQQVEQLTATGLSLMPEGVEDTIPPAQMADLLAYIHNQR